MEAARADTVTTSSLDSAPLSTASITSSRVITLVTLAGSSLSWGFCSYKIVPVSFSISTAAPASTAGAPAAAPAAGCSAARAGRIRNAAASRAAASCFIRYHASVCKSLFQRMWNPGRFYTAGPRFLPVGKFSGFPLYNSTLVW